MTATPDLGAITDQRLPLKGKEQLEPLTDASLIGTNERRTKPEASLQLAPMSTTTSLRPPTPARRSLAVLFTDPGQADLLDKVLMHLPTAVLRRLVMVSSAYGVLGTILTQGRCAGTSVKSSAAR